jgi:hypothetical protein
VKTFRTAKFGKHDPPAHRQSHANILSLASPVLALKWPPYFADWENRPFATLWMEEKINGQVLTGASDTDVKTST